MKLTTTQIDVLTYLRDDHPLKVGDGKVNERTMYALYTRGLIKCPRYANGEFWELTHKGLDEIDSIRPL
jgi:hypothetical protein